MISLLRSALINSRHACVTCLYNGWKTTFCHVSMAIYEHEGVASRRSSAVTYGVDIVDILSSRVVLSLYPVPVDVRAEVIHHLARELILLPAIGVEPKHVFALQIEAALEAIHDGAIVRRSVALSIDSREVQGYSRRFDLLLSAAKERCETCAALSSLAICISPHLADTVEVIFQVVLQFTVQLAADDVRSVLRGALVQRAHCSLRRRNRASRL